MNCKDSKMDLLFNANGTANRAYRPYIDQEETTRVFTLYDPNRPINWGLYDGPQPPCGSLQANFILSNPSPYPARTITKNCGELVQNPRTIDIIAKHFPKAAQQQQQRFEKMGRYDLEQSTYRN